MTLVPYVIEKSGREERAMDIYSRLLKDRIIFGSAYPLGPIGRTIAEIRALPIGEEVEKLWLHDNAKRFLRL